MEVRSLVYEKAFHMVGLELLTINHKFNRVTTLKEQLLLFNRNPNETLGYSIPFDQSWNQFKTTENKQELKFSAS